MPSCLMKNRYLSLSRKIPKNHLTTEIHCRPLPYNDRRRPLVARRLDHCVSYTSISIANGCDGAAVRAQYNCSRHSFDLLQPSCPTRPSSIMRKTMSHAACGELGQIEFLL